MLMATKRLTKESKLWYNAIHRREAVNIASEAQLKAQDKYDKANTKKFCLKLNLSTDKDVIKKLDEVPSKQGYIKGLIRADIANQDDD